MTTLFLGGFLQASLVTTFVGLCVLLCLIILIQKPKGGGLSGAFGGAGGGGQVFGGKSGDILTWITVGFFMAFIFVGMALVVVTRNEARSKGPAVETSPTVTESVLPESGDEVPPVVPATPEGEAKDGAETAKPEAAPVPPATTEPGDPPATPPN